MHLGAAWGTPHGPTTEAPLSRSDLRSILLDGFDEVLTDPSERRAWAYATIHGSDPDSFPDGVHVPIHLVGPWIQRIARYDNIPAIKELLGAQTSAKQVEQALATRAHDLVFVVGENYRGGWSLGGFAGIDGYQRP